MLFDIMERRASFDQMRVLPVRHQHKPLLHYHIEYLPLIREMRLLCFILGQNRATAATSEMVWPLLFQY